MFVEIKRRACEHKISTVKSEVFSLYILENTFILMFRADRNSDKDAETHLLEEQRLQQSYIHVLDTSILKLFVNK
jgi:hypothetical protein